MGLVCIDGACVSPEDDLPPGSEDCGIVGRTCCPGFTCRSGLVCSEGTCRACGEEGQPCCDGATACVGSLACDVTTGTCVNADPATACGEIDRPCCPDPTTGVPSDCSGDLVCRGGTCLRPDDTGFDGAPCGPRDSCDPGLVCDRRTDPSGICEMTPADCGRDGQMCCDLGGSESICEGSLHCQFGECSTCRGPSLTCLLGGLLPGQQCCAGSVCRPAPLVPRCCMGQGGRCENSLDCCGLMSCGSDGTCSCSRENSFCLDSSECCEGLICDTFLCRPMGPMCKESGSACSSSGECCAGLACSEVRPDRTAPAVRQCCAGAGTSCATAEDCCGQMACMRGECQCVERGGSCDRDIECCGSDICVAGNCVDGTGCSRERESCETTPCCGSELRCLADPRVCCAGAGQRCYGDEDCCGLMVCGEDQTCQCRRPADPDLGTPAESCVHTIECCGASFCSAEGVCTFGEP